MGLDRRRFATVARDYLRDLCESGEGGALQPADERRIDAIMDEVDAIVARLGARAGILDVIGADGEAAEVERVLYAHVVHRWASAPRSPERSHMSLRAAPAAVRMPASRAQV